MNPQHEKQTGKVIWDVADGKGRPVHSNGKFVISKRGLLASVGAGLLALLGIGIGKKLATPAVPAQKGATLVDDVHGDAPAPQFVDDVHGDAPAPQQLADHGDAPAPQQFADHGDAPAPQQLADDVHGDAPAPQSGIA